MKLSDTWRTPDWLFNQLDSEFKFDVDLAATEENAKKPFIKDLFNFSMSELENLHPKAGFLNPPYSNPYPFIAKALVLQHYMTVVCLIKVDPSTKWWSLFWDYENHKGKEGIEVRFLNKRVKFDPPIGYIGKTSTPSFASAIVIMRKL